VGFGIVVGEQVLRRPTEALMEAAEKWTAGDLSARIDVENAEGTEFGRIGTAFNRLADTLGRRHDELRALNAELEARVAERTEALSAANTRLVAEMAERERAEATLRQAQKLQAVGQLAGRFAHDFNNVLTAIVAALDVLRGRTGSNQEASLRLIDTALNAGERGRKLTGQLLSFSGRQRLTPMPTDLNDTVTALVDLLANTLGAGIHVETAFSPDLWHAQVDPSQAEAAILNLAVNARDAMPEGGRLRFVTRNVTLGAHEKVRAGDYVAVEVTDTGIGMSEEIARMAFEPFFTTKSDTKASGLGLSQVHGLAKQSGGDVSIRSVPDLGTTVTLLLPRSTEVAMGEPISAPERVVEPAPDGKCRTRLQVIRGGMADSL
jgi:signal transduction histidine kinase